MTHPMKRLPKYFLRGSLVLVPIAAALWVLWSVLSSVDRILPFAIPGLGLVVTIALVTLVGFLASNVVGNAVVASVEAALGRVPFFKLVYGSIHDLLNAFVGEKKSFDRPVAVTLIPGSGVRVLGFVTREALLGEGDLVAVYLPQSYNFAGFLVLVPSAQVEPLAVTGAELMTFVVSGGVSGVLRATPAS